MSKVAFAARRLVESNLGWFLQTRRSLGEAAGRERAININKDILADWVTSDALIEGGAIDVVTRYLSDAEFATHSPVITEDRRSIRNQGGGKNWRLAGDGIEGARYDVRVGDLMIMAFDRQSATLGWVIVRGGASGAVPDEESSAHSQILGILGVDSGSMWTIEGEKIAQILQLIEPFLPGATQVLMFNRFLLGEWSGALLDSGVIVQDDVDSRLFRALQAKPFLILTGLSGSGKTLLARSFARWLCDSREQYCLVAVGANWTGRDNLLGYPDAFDISAYHRTPCLDVLLHAIENPSVPHVLILDEMNLSHVERYFSDFLSGMETIDEKLFLHSDAGLRSGVPGCLPGIPSNLFVIGTVNVDETTYMFSPKVLDRANVIEFRSPEFAINKALSGLATASINRLDRTGAFGGRLFVALARGRPTLLQSQQRAHSILISEMSKLFSLLAEHRWEFGIRTANEMRRYILLSLEAMLRKEPHSDDECLRRIIDEQIVQKVLPRLHGSRKNIEPLLLRLLVFAAFRRRWKSVVDDEIYEDAAAFYAALSDDPVQRWVASEPPMFPMSTRKISRMLSQLQDGYTSFAES
jgi:hypothetical protein